jgi:hypothetical protein
MRVVAALALLLFSVEARAFDLRVLTGLDTLLTTDFHGAQDAELGINARVDLRDLAKRWDFKLDFQGREGFSGTGSWNNLYQLSAKAKNLAGMLDVTFGRFRVPTGFWLVADGAMLTVKYSSWLKQAVFGGLRSFSTGRYNTWMDDQPHAIPLVGTSLLLNHRYITGSLGFTWSRDLIRLRGGTYQPPPTDHVDFEIHQPDEYFLDANVTLYPHEKVFLSAGASFGTRYDVQFNASNPYGATSLGVATLGSFDGFGVAEYRPWKRLRLQYTFNFERVRLFQSQLLATDANGQPLTAADGSFEDHDFRVIGLLWQALRGEINYRLRIRANTDYEHHLTAGLRGDHLWKGLGLFGSVGVDIDSGLAVAGGAAVKKIHDRIIYSAGLSWVHRVADVRAGVTYTDGLGSGLSFSQHSATGTGAAPTELFPYVLDTNRIAFVRAFAMFWKMYAGVDVEFNLTSAQMRMLAQIGGSL